MDKGIRILVVDDERNMCEFLADLLGEEGYRVSWVQEGKEALDKLRETPVDLAIVDIRMPGLDGIEVLKGIKSYNENIEVIILTGYGTVDTAVEAMKQGASDYLRKPCNCEETKLVVRSALRHKALLEENRELRQKLEVREGLGPLIGKSDKMQKVYEGIRSAADTDLTVLIQGETGVGKELIASAIHHKSSRSKKKFIRVNCATFTETLLESELFGHTKGAFTGATHDKKGLFESANGGSLFLDEVADLEAGTQAKLLRVIEYGEFMRVGDTKPIKVNVRVIASTNRELKKLAQEGKFREDLYYRLNVYTIWVPALRERVEDIPLFISYFLKEYNQSLGKSFKGVSKRALNMLTRYDWPGNVRELENVLVRAVAKGRGSIITPSDIEAYLPAQPLESKTGSFQELKQRTVEDFERKYLIQILKQSRGNISLSARQIGMDRKNLRDKLKRYGIRARDFKK